MGKSSHPEIQSQISRRGFLAAGVASAAMVGLGTAGTAIEAEATQIGRAHV